MGSLVAPAANYFESLGLALDPFADGSMPAFFFVGGQRRYLAERAVHLLYFSGAIVLMLGASGTGKSRVLDEIEAALGDIADVCRIEATVMTDGAQLRTLLAQAIGLSTAAANNAAEFVSALRTTRPGEDEPLPVVLLLDSAHLLSIAALAETVALTQSADGRLRLLLAGQNELAMSWQQTSAFGALSHAGSAETLQLPGLDRQETADYLHTRLQAAGASCAIPLDSAALDELYERSGGNLGAIHTLAPQLFTPAAAKHNAARGKSLPIVHIGVIAALLAAVLMLILYRGSGSPAAGSATTNDAPAATSSDQRSVPLALPGIKNSSSQPPGTRIQPAPIPEQVEPAESPRSIPTPTPAPPKRTEPKPVEPVANKVVPAPTPKPAIPEPVVKPVKEQGEPSYAADERDLLVLPSQQFLLQLLGAESRATVDKFKVGAGHGQNLLIYRTQLRGKPWFIVMTGPYPTRAAALAAVAQMPDVLRKQQPWPRSVANVQADIRAHSSR